MEKMKFVVIGITDSPTPFFPPEVLAVIKKGKVFSGGKRHHEIVRPLLPDGANWIDITVPLDAVFEQYHGEVIVFASGDPLFFGFANTIRRKMPDANIILYPTFHSLQMLAHRLLMPYHDMRIVSLTGRPWHEFDRALIEQVSQMGVLTDKEHTPATIAQRMKDYGYTNYVMHIGEHLGNPEQEKVTTLSLDEAAARDFSSPNCLILSSCHTNGDTEKALTNALSVRPFGIPDKEFSLLDGRTKMITKMPIRLLSLQALDLPRKHTLWDIGFCTGSISIEARLLFPHLHVVAFEVRPECEALMHENSHRFRAPGIDIHIGDFLSVPLPTPAPDAAFIGGHNGQLKAIMERLASIMPPQGTIVMNAVTPQSETLFAEACQEFGLIQYPSTHILLNDNNPINILKCELPSSPFQRQA